MNRRRFPAFLAWLAAALILTVSFSSQSISPAIAQQTPLTVSAAISLSNALQEIKSLYQRRQPSVNITYNFGASGSLEQQIEQGAPVDVFFSAATKQMDALQQKNLLVSGTRRNLLTNNLVLITPSNSPTLSSFKDLLGSQIEKIAIGEPRSVPAGQYAQEVLTNLKIFDALRPKLVYGSNVRQVLTFVETGNANAGIVYTTDAKQSSAVKIGATAPSTSHSPIVYPVAVLKDSQNVSAAKDFVQFLSSSQSQAMFQKYGFGIAR